METNTEYKLLISKETSEMNEENNVIVCDIIIPESYRDEFSKLLNNKDSDIKNAVLLFRMENSNISRKVNFVINANSITGDQLDIPVPKNNEKESEEDISNTSFSIPYISVDEKFRKQILALIEENISNPNFDVDDIVSKIGMSRAQLYRKLEMLSGETVKEFVRNIRLRSAAKLLNNNNIRISEVMGMVGFSNRAYFIKCFKQQFGICPSDYKKQFVAA